MQDDRVTTDPDFIIAPKFENSLAKYLERYPDGVPAANAAKVLGLTEDELSLVRDQALTKLRNRI